MATPQRFEGETVSEPELASAGADIIRFPNGELVTGSEMAVRGIKNQLLFDRIKSSVEDRRWSAEEAAIIYGAYDPDSHVKPEDFYK